MQNRDEKLLKLMESAVGESLPTWQSTPGIQACLARKRRNRKLGFGLGYSLAACVVICCLWVPQQVLNQRDKGLIQTERFVDVAFIQNDNLPSGMIVVSSGVQEIGIVRSQASSFAMVRNIPAEDLFLSEDQFLEILYASGGGFEMRNGERRYYFMKDDRFEQI